MNHPIDPTSVLCFPREKNPTISPGLRAKILAALATRYDKPLAAVRRHFSDQNVEFWGKIRRLGEGDTMRAAAMMKSSTEDGRDASYVKVYTPALCRIFGLVTGKF
jgi:hypothetical protein